jgi:hypothetical protein
MRLYARARVEAVEASSAWPRLQERVARRKAAAAKAVETKAQRLWDYLLEAEYARQLQTKREHEGMREFLRQR